MLIGALPSRRDAPAPKCSGQRELRISNKNKPFVGRTFPSPQIYNLFTCLGPLGAAAQNIPQLEILCDTVVGMDVDPCQCQARLLRLPVLPNLSALLPCCFPSSRSEMLPKATAGAAESAAAAPAAAASFGPALKSFLAWPKVEGRQKTET